MEASIGKLVIKDASLNKSIAVISPGDNHNFDFNKTVVSTTGGFAITGGFGASITELAVDTGLTTITGFSLTPQAKNAANINKAVTLSGVSSGGTLTIYRWVATMEASSTLIAATAAGTVSWLAFGNI